MGKLTSTSSTIGGKLQSGVNTIGGDIFSPIDSFIKTDETLSFTNGVLGVNTAKEPEINNTLPITAAAVATTVGNIETILKII